MPIRTDDEHDAFDDLHDYFVRHQDALRRWLNDIEYAYVNVELASAAVLAVESRLGRGVSRETGAAIGWLVTYIQDMVVHSDRLRGRGMIGRAFQMAWDDAMGTVRGAAVSHFTGLHPHAVAQIPIAAKHIRDDHLLS